MPVLEFVKEAVEKAPPSTAGGSTASPQLKIEVQALPVSVLAQY